MIQQSRIWLYCQKSWNQDFRDTCIPIFIAALFTVGSVWKPPKCTSTNEWRKEMWYRNIVEYYSVFKKKEILPFTATHEWIWRTLCTYMLSYFSCVQLFVTPWTAASQVPLFMGFSRQEYWSGLPYPPPGDLPDPGIETASLMSPALAGGFFTTSATLCYMN